MKNPDMIIASVIFTVAIICMLIFQAPIVILIWYPAGFYIVINLDR